jgi:hypothetical protein
LRHMMKTLWMVLRVVIIVGYRQSWKKDPDVSAASLSTQRHHDIMTWIFNRLTVGGRTTGPGSSAVGRLTARHMLVVTAIRARAEVSNDWYMLQH